MSTVGENINEVERTAAEKAGVKYAVALCNCTSALHLCCKFASEKLYGKPAISHGSLNQLTYYKGKIINRLQTEHFAMDIRIECFLPFTVFFYPRPLEL